MRSRRRAPAAVAALLTLLAAPLAAQAEDASGPAGDSPVCADRPTKALSTCVVDQGYVQLETDLFNGSFQRTGGVTTDVYLSPNPTLKYGLTKTLDLEAQIAPYEVVRTHDKFGVGGALGGVGDLYLRAKYAAYADPKLTVSIDPYVKAPTARLGVGNGAWEGGAVAIVSYKLTDAWSVTLAPELDAYADAEGAGAHLNHVELVNISRSLPHNVTVYGELWGDWNYDPTGRVDQYSADVAVSWGVTKSLQLDGGLNFGLNRETPGVQVYAGLAQRF